MSMKIRAHGHVEVRKDNEWHHYSVHVSDYEELLFDAIQHTCRDIHRTFQNLPFNMSNITALCYNNDVNRMNIKISGFLDKEEMHAFHNRLIQDFSNERFASQKRDIYELVRDFDTDSIITYEDWQDVRLVFWFDN